MTYLYQNVRHLAAWVVLFGLALALPPAFAQTQGQQEQNQQERNKGGGQNQKMNFDQLDTDRDGYLAQSEAAAYAQLSNNFGRADTNGDGKVSRDEFQDWHSKSGNR